MPALMKTLVAPAKSAPAMANTHQGSESMKGMASSEREKQVAGSRNQEEKRQASLANFLLPAS
jgi:hypothetical protein